MTTDSLLQPQYDPMGAAILEYQQKHTASRLRVRSSMFEEDEIPVPHLFRSFDDMPELEQKALLMTQGRILDVGAGAGCHALWLQAHQQDVTAIDISSLSCQAMELRGLKQVRCVNLFDPALAGPFDTILMLMNGTGIVGKLSQMPAFMERVKELLSPHGQLLIDSSDLRYLYENEDGSYDIDLNGDYYGEVDYQMIYRKVKGHSFPWLYTDYMTLARYAHESGLRCELIQEGEHYDYLARICNK